MLKLSKEEGIIYRAKKEVFDDIEVIFQNLFPLRQHKGFQREWNDLKKRHLSTSQNSDLNGSLHSP